MVWILAFHDHFLAEMVHLLRCVNMYSIFQRMSDLLPGEPVGEAVFEIIPHQDELSVRKRMVEQRRHSLFREMRFPAEQREGDLFFGVVTNYATQGWTDAGGMPYVQHVRFQIQRVNESEAGAVLPVQRNGKSRLEEKDEQDAELVHIGIVWGNDNWDN